MRCDTRRSGSSPSRRRFPFPQAVTPLAAAAAASTMKASYSAEIAVLKVELHRQIEQGQGGCGARRKGCCNVHRHKLESCRHTHNTASRCNPCTYHLLFRVIGAFFYAQFEEISWARPNPPRVPECFHTLPEAGDHFHARTTVRDMNSSPSGKQRGKGPCASAPACQGKLSSFRKGGQGREKTRSRYHGTYERGQNRGPKKV